MRKVIDKKVYDTETADFITSVCNGYLSNDFQYQLEDLYKTKKGKFFIYGEGGPLSLYSEKFGNTFSGTSIIILKSDDEVYEWLEENDKIDIIEEYFKDKIEEA